ncbi:MAG TPA: hypothetical protein VMU16_06630 [Candidatus Binataceae bacterium]|nr:hypothetical protein [Candidatus Binataceae bacterium]
MPQVPEHERRARPEEVPPRRTSSDSEERLIRSEQSTLAKLSQVVRLADFMALLMVIATLFSAYATWRTAMVTERVFSVTDRPFMGMQSVTFEHTELPTPTITVKVVNFGQIPATDLIMNVHALLDGKPLVQPNKAMTEHEVGIVSPTVPHYFYYYLTQDAYRAITSGKSRLQLHVKLEYEGASREHTFCYFERVIYDPRVGEFRADSGGDKCGTDVY